MAQPVYLIDRFDRVAPAESRGDLATRADLVRRRHVIDTCQLLNKARNFKYSAAHLDTLVEAIGQCRAKAAALLATCGASTSSPATSAVNGFSHP